MKAKHKLDIIDDFPEPIVRVLDEEITILLPHLVKRIMTIVDYEREEDERSPLYKSQHGKAG